jgi:branched-chain amino acid aminotransferase
MTLGQEFLTYVNGRVMPHSQALPELQRINMRSAGGYYDSARTFGGRPFQLRRHLERLFSGLAYSNIDPGITIDDLEKTSRGIIDANFTLFEGGPGDMVVTQTITVTRPVSADDLPSVDIAIYCTPLEFSSFARSYVDGVRLYTPITYPKPQEAEDGDGKQGSTQTLALMVNDGGFITECQGANFMFVMDGRIKLPDRRNVLPGVSMHTILELAARLGIGVDEGLYSPALIYGAEEAFVSSTRYCMLPVATLNGYQVGRATPGKVTENLMSAWKNMVGIDFIQQALSSLPGNG